MRRDAILARFETLWPWLLPFLAAVIVYSLVSMVTGGIFILFEVGIAIGVFVLLRRMLRGGE